MKSWHADIIEVLNTYSEMIVEEALPSITWCFLALKAWHHP